MLHNFICCHQTYNYVRPWSAPPGQSPLVTQIHAHSGAPLPQSGQTTQFNGVYQVCKHSMLTQSTQVGCSCAWALAFYPKPQIGAVMPTQKPHNPAARKVSPPCAPPICTFAQRVHWNSVDFFPISALCIWWFSQLWTIFWESCCFSSGTINDA